MKKTELKIGTAICLILHTVAGIAGITALFLPFTEDISPVSFVVSLSSSDFLFWHNLLFAITFFLPVFVSAAFVRWMISGLLSRTERAIAYVMSSMMALGILNFITSFLLPDFWNQSSNLPFCVRCWLILVIPLLLLLFGVYVVIKNLRNKEPKGVSAVMAMQIAYMSNALLCLTLYFERLQIGAYFVVVTVGVYLTQIVMTTVKLGVFRRGGESGSV